MFVIKALIKPNIFKKLINSFQNQVANQPSEIQRQSLTALAACCPVRHANSGPVTTALSPDQLVEALACTVSVLTAWTTGGGARSPTEDNLHSRFLATVVRTLNCLIVEVCESFSLGDVAEMIIYS